MQKGLLLLALLTTVAMSCGRKESGQLVGVLDRPKWKGVNPYGMNHIPSGTLHIGSGDEDISKTMVARPKSISIQGFFMDDTEISNNEYRQFVQWVLDSVAHERMEHFTTDEEEDGGGSEKQRIDWEQEVDWEEGSEELEDVFFAGNDRFDGRKEINTDKLVFETQWYDWQSAAHDKNSNRTAHIKKEKVKIYPDTLAWIRDFAYSYNEPYTRNYFWHPAFDNYPVVGIDWKQAKAFCFWRTKLWNMYAAGEGIVNSEDFRLPTEHEWEYAARGGRDNAPYPWGAYYTRNAKGCLLANFKPGRGNYPEDGGLYTVPVDKYYPNDFGLYCMSGNVAEWTETAYYENAYSFIHDLNPDIRRDAKDEDALTFKRKVIRGGSWKDIAYFMQTGTRAWEYQDTNKCYIGFRCVLTFLGRSINDF